MHETITDPIGRYVTDRRFRLLIGGELVEPAARTSMPTMNPSTGDVLTDAPVAGTADVERAIGAAKVAQRDWAGLGVRGRRVHLHRFAEAILERKPELAMLDALDCGNPFQAMLVDIDHALRALEDWPALALGLEGRVVPEASPGRNLHYTMLEPFGVVGRIIPFNHPAMFAIVGVVPALVMGNTVVLKPAEQTPLSALALGEIAAEALPAGVLNIVSGGIEAGESLVGATDVRRIAFTGSTATGLAIQRHAAESTVKHVSLELGGKNALIVFPDADVASAVRGAVLGMNLTTCQGQSCGSTSRVFVHASTYEPFVEGLRDALESITVGPAYESGIDMGPVVSAVHRDRVQDYVAAGRSAGARLITGGETPPGLGGGYYVAPTAFGDVGMEMRVAREEIFGPVVCVLPWRDYEEMLAQANDVEFGLTASVWTSDIDIAHRTAQRLKAGYVWINDSAKHFFGMPFGGTKNSGVGREESVEELLGYCELKAVHTILGDPAEALRRMTRP